ncbi:MAG: cytochrome c [Sedimenticola sp.]
MKRSAFLIGLTSLVFAAGLQAHGSPLEYRQGAMNLLAWNMKPMGRMVKGEMSFDKAVFKRHADDLTAVVHLDLLSGFPDDSDSGETDALPDIWLDFEDFTAKYRDMQKAAKTLSKAAAGGDMEKIKPAFGALGKSCKACHKPYRN